MKFFITVKNILLGLLALIFIYAIKLFFLITSFISLGVIGYSMFMLVSVMLGGDMGTYMSQLITVALFSICYLYITTLLGVGMSDIIKLINLILQLMKGSKTSNNGNSRMGEKGVFKR